MLQLRRKIGYGLGDMGLSISYFTVSMFFLYYLTDIVGLQPSLAGLAYFIGMAWDSINDPLVGALNDRLVSRLGRKRAFLLYGALPYALGFILLWMIPLEGTQTLKFIFATAAMLLYTTCYSVISVPYMALVPVMSADYDERTQIVGVRAILSTVGTLLGGAAAMLVSSFDSELTGLRVMAFGFALWVLVSVWTAARSVRGLEPANQPPAPGALLDLRLYARLARERNVSTLLLFKLLGAVATGSLLAAMPYFSRHILGDEGRSTIGLGVYILVAAAFIPLWERLARRFDKRRLLFWAMLGLALALPPVAFFSSAEGILVFFVGCAVLGVFMAAYTLIAYSFPPDLVDYYQQRTGERRDSALFGLWLTAHQLGVGLAGLLLGGFLQVFGYDGALETQSGPALLAVRLGLGVLPGLAMLAAVLVLQRYTITRQVYQQIHQALAAEGAGPAAPAAAHD